MNLLKVNQVEIKRRKKLSIFYKLTVENYLISAVVVSSSLLFGEYHSVLNCSFLQSGILSSYEKKYIHIAGRKIKLSITWLSELI